GICGLRVELRPAVGSGHVSLASNHTTHTQQGSGETSSPHHGDIGSGGICGSPHAPRTIGAWVFEHRGELVGHLALTTPDTERRFALTRRIRQPVAPRWPLSSGVPLKPADADPGE